ncbi:D-alanyl-D-alanine carboxypeptidase [Streptomyces sp. WAC 06725]|uniref:D-alanyl-D-alanine carboxypeptidase n=1 Tax=Streptomyces sp. WAC 06725 TaxID=2203209 RepID=UPI000F74055E|nr:D-alanyl-D-alanine carboxypeptidase [Streptomyces sp. WAC 06725]RSO33821.1 D-alanyl-D-alanine carboxypeptidase [Streptomyces sp. WAC 06725]
MAGESPGKPEQKQSSGETAGSERDPRLAVFREAPRPDEKAGERGEKTGKKGGKPGDEGETAEKADKSDKTGGVRKPGAAGEGRTADEAGTTGEGAADGKGSAGGKGAADGKADAGGEGRDARLREAVAAWVATSDEDGAEGASGEAEAKPENRAKDEAAEAPVTKASADAGTAAKQTSEGAAKGAAADGAKGAAKGASGGASGGADKRAAEDAPQGASEGPSKGGGKASGSASGDKAGAGTSGAQSGAKGTAASAAATEGEPKVVQQPKSVDQPTAIFKAPSADEAAGKPVDNATRTFSIAKQKDSDGGPAKPAKDADAAGKGDAKADAKADAKTDAKAATKTDPAPGKSDAKPSDAKPSDGKAPASKPAADQPTTAIKAVRPSGAAESDGERTSQFVALKSTDPQPIKPPRPVVTDKPGKQGKAGKPGKAEKGSAKTDAAKTEDKPTTKAATGTDTKPAAEPDVAPGTTWGAKAAGTAGADAKTATPEAPAGATTGTTAPPGALPDSEQTKQQPLPPLDLLAQLTNTPPPPETPMRTVARRFKIWTPVVVLLAIIFVVVQQVRPLPDPELAVGSSTAYTFQGGKLEVPWPDQGQSAAKVVGVGSVGTSGQAKPVPTASVAKVMTAYVILRDHPLKKGEKGETITVDAQGEADSKKQDESRVPLKQGQRFNQYQMLQMLMIPSGNNVARQLARWDSGSEGAFAKKMNAAAKELGMTQTTYTDPSGLDKSTVSTSVDQLKLAEAVMKNDAFRSVVTTENVQIDGLPVRLFNNNSLLTTMPGVVRGIKTGSSTPAGGTFMWAAYRTVGGKDQLLLGVMMDQRANSTDPNAHLALVLKNSQKVVSAVRDALVSDTVVKKGQVVGYVDDGIGGHTPVVATKDLSAVGWPGMKATFSMSGAGKPVPHEAKAGTVVGELTVGTGSTAAKVPVALQKNLAEPTFGAKLTRIS